MGRPGLSPGFVCAADCLCDFESAFPLSGLKVLCLHGTDENSAILFCSSRSSVWFSHKSVRSCHSFPSPADIVYWSLNIVISLSEAWVGLLLLVLVYIVLFLCVCACLYLTMTVL